MNATIEERLARYAAQLDDAAERVVLPDARAARAPRRGPLAAALAAGAVVVLALGVAIANRGDHHAPVAPPSIATSVAPTTPPSSAAPTTTPQTTTTTTTSTTTAPVVGTRQVVYQPFNGAVVDSTLHVTAQDSGSCRHEPSGGHDYYRCFSTGGTIYDPCFAGTVGTAQPLVCPSDPTTPNVVTFSATSVTQDSGPSVPHPWAVQLSGGRVCLFVSAAWGALGPYSCSASSGNPPVADCHVPTQGLPYWTIECQRVLTDTSPFTSERVAAVWY
jgi:hypothetical protein